MSDRDYCEHNHMYTMGHCSQCAITKGNKMKTEKLSGSIWVKPRVWELIKKDRDCHNVIEFGYTNSQAPKYPIELTITAKMPERKREFTESELQGLFDYYNKNGVPSADVVDQAFKDVTE